MKNDKKAHLYKEAQAQKMDDYLSSYKILHDGHDAGEHNLWCGPGWYPLIIEMFEELIEAGWNKQFSQIKEKWGMLTVYLDSYNDDLDSILQKYELLSTKVCEICGNKGKRRQIKGWCISLCGRCAKERSL